MKTLAIIGKSLKVAVYAGLVTFAVKLLAVYYYGYRSVDLAYAGPYFYYWSVKYVDQKLPRTTYTKNKLESQPKSDLFARYLDRVQGSGNKKLDVPPYYAYKLPDTQVREASKTWTIFKTNAAQDVEFSFLNLRGNFIRMMHKITGTEVDKIKLPFFVQLAPEEVKSFFSDAKNGLVPYATFQSIVSKLVDGKKGYGVTVSGDQAKMSPEFEKDVMPIVQSVFKGFSLSVQDVNDFFTRVAAIKMTPMDVHILNRIKLYFLYANSYLDVSKFGNADYDAAVQRINELEKLKASEGDKFDNNKKHKLKVAHKNKNQLRTEMILNKASYLFASLFGNPVLARDDRSIAPWFGAPGVATEKNLTVKADPKKFDEQLRANITA
ncbi:hypothetical protein PAPHI01_0108 [Pancytospora philotis]|nr:hypothetical protein PAPHI01_0108 [Pancytospora philotis]